MGLETNQDWSASHESSFSSTDVDWSKPFTDIALAKPAGNLRPLPIRCAPAALRHVGADEARRHGVCGDLRDDSPSTRGRNLSDQRLGRISRKALG